MSERISVRTIRRLCVIAMLAFAVCALGGGAASSAIVPNAAPFASEAALTTIFTFSDPSMGSKPQSPLAFDDDGDYYGTTLAGGPGNGGVAFELKPAGGTYVEEILYAFGRDTTLGIQPGPLSRDANGNLFGMTRRGIVELTRGPNGWYGKLLYDCDTENYGFPYADRRVTLAGGNVYGVCEGGSQVVELSPAGSGYAATKIYQFPKHAIFPNGGLLVDANGAIMGTAFENGSCCGSEGPTYTLTPDGAGYRYKKLFTFTTTVGPAVDRFGNIWEIGFGTSPDSYGSLLVATPNGSGYELRTRDGKHGFEGFGSYTSTAAIGVTADVYFLTGDFATKNEMVYRLTPTGTGYQWHAFYTFAPKIIVQQLSVDPRGVVMGATQYNDGSGRGTIFRLIPTR